MISKIYMVKLKFLQTFTKTHAKFFWDFCQKNIFFWVFWKNYYGVIFEHFEKLFKNLKHWILPCKNQGSKNEFLSPVSFSIPPPLPFFPKTVETWKTYFQCIKSSEILKTKFILLILDFVFFLWSKFYGIEMTKKWWGF